MNEEAERGEGKGETEGAKEGGREVGGEKRKGEEKGCPCAHMSLQAPLNAAHQGSESSVDVTRGSVHFWNGGRIAGSRQGLDIFPYSSQATLSLA